MRAFARLLEGKIPEAAVIPTGLGKTSIVLMHLLALVAGAPLPRRVAYVVDRRAVVDQTATILRLWVRRLPAIPEIKAKLDRLAAFDAPVPVTLAILPGGLADDGEWRTDPARPAVLVGTVDMIGSRLLFSGYGNGRSRRAMDAGLIRHARAGCQGHSQIDAQA
jgi:CRISPR-associated endonuclease/helicase Cas3